LPYPTPGHSLSNQGCPSYVASDLLPFLLLASVLELLTQLAFLNIRVEREVIWVLKYFRNLANRDAQLQQLLDACAIRVKLALLQRSLWLSECNPLTFLRAQGFPGSHADQIALQFGQQRKHGYDNLRTHIMFAGAEINVLFQCDEPDPPRDQFIHQGDNFGGVAAQGGQLRDDQRIAWL
jgi:hypothetical protein